VGCPVSETAAVGELLQSERWSLEDLERFAREIDRLVPVDLGIVRGVKILKDAGFTTIESCEGGKGHSYAEPTIQFVGSHATGWAAMAELMTYGLPSGAWGKCGRLITATARDTPPVRSGSLPSIESCCQYGK